MKKLLPPLLATVLVLAGCSTPTDDRAQAADITVDFRDPDKFRDAAESLGGSTDENALAELRAYLKETAPTCLKSGQKLHVTFTDLDLAGDFVSGQMDRVRLIKPIYFPRQEITFALTDAAGQTLKQGTRVLTDLDFQSTHLRLGSSVSYFHDKMLLKDWLQKEFR